MSTTAVIDRVRAVAVFPTNFLSRKTRNAPNTKQVIYHALASRNFTEKILLVEKTVESIVQEIKTKRRMISGCDNIFLPNAAGSQIKYQTDTRQYSMDYRKGKINCLQRIHWKKLPLRKGYNNMIN